MSRVLLLVPSALALGLAVFSGSAGSHEDHRGSRNGARTVYAFPVAPPGSYNLPPIMRAAGGPVLDETGRRHELAELLSARTTVFAFVYTRCGDVCPTATLDMSQLQDLAAKDQRLSNVVRLITMSFDPEHDTPEVMRAFAGQWRSGNRAAPEWLFLTGPDRQTVEPLLAAYNQRVDRGPETGSRNGLINHVFRAFLIDEDGLIRNIYSLDFLDPNLVLNDVRTLLEERLR